MPRDPIPMPAGSLAWITMRGDDADIDAIMENPRRRTRGHAVSRRDADGSGCTDCGRAIPRRDNCLGYIEPGDPEWPSIVACKSCFVHSADETPKRAPKKKATKRAPARLMAKFNI